MSAEFRVFSLPATSNAPAPRRKRRLSSTERDVRQETEELARGKKARSGSQSPEAKPQEERETPLPQPEEVETKEVKEVTKGVEEVVLDDPSEKPASDVEEKEEKPAPEEPIVAPESVPLPEDGNAELDDLADAPSSPARSEDEMIPVDLKEAQDAQDVGVQASEPKTEEEASTAVTSEATMEKQDTEDVEESKSDVPASKPTQKEPSSEENRDEAVVAV